MMVEKMNLKFNKNIIRNKKDNRNIMNSQVQKDKLKARIMDKYNLPLEDAEKIISKLEEKQKSNSVNSQSNINSNFQQQKNNQIKNYQLNEKSNDYIKLQQPVNLQNNVNNKTNLPSSETNDSEKFYFEHNQENVDSLVGEFVPDYNKIVSIELNNVDLTFEIELEKIDTIKEKVIKTLTRKKPKKLKVHALNNFSLKIYKGEKIGIIGYNGAGKSTLLKVISGIYTPDNGSVKTFGNIAPLLSLGAGFDFNYSGRQNIMLNGAVLGFEKDYLLEKMDEIIEFSELGEYIDVPIKNYSSGMISKLGFSIAALSDPDILIIDEILGVGDVNFRKKSNDKIKSLMESGTTVLLVSHSIPEIRAICDKAIWIDDGELKEFGEVNKICDDYLRDAEKASIEQKENIQFL